MNKEQEIIETSRIALNAALDLISRQREEIERLTLSEREAYKQLERGNERMMAIIAEEREDAVKEFVKELKKRKYQSSDWSHGEHPYVVEESDIDDVLYQIAEVGNLVKGE